MFLAPARSQIRRKTLHVAVLYDIRPSSLLGSQAPLRQTMIYALCLLTSDCDLHFVICPWLLSHYCNTLLVKHCIGAVGIC